MTIARTQPGEFPRQVVDLMTTFASQSALPMQNARLFHQLEIASHHKSQFLANMSHELRTPLIAILGCTELIVDQIYGEVSEKIEEVPDRVQKSGQHLVVSDQRRARPLEDRSQPTDARAEQLRAQ